MATRESSLADTPADDIRPIVARTPSNRGAWIFAGALALGGVILFSALEGRRSAVMRPTLSPPPVSGGGMISPPPELAIPSPEFDYGFPSIAPLAQLPPSLVPSVSAPSSPRQMAQRPGRAPDYMPYYPPAGLELTTVRPQASSPAFAYQSSTPRGPAEPANNTGAKDARAQASRLLNPRTTVAQGTVIQAVLETALDTNHAGFARAVVSRDVSSFDGSRVLIPKGSKLFGEYKADLSRGQNRALIQWHRLTRPDGTIIDVDSPTADTLGRVGVKGKVNSHFFERFSGAILQSGLDIGVQLATRRVADDTVIIGLPGSTPQGLIQNPGDIKPTITVRQGSSVSVFVARDLDFTPVE